MMHSRSFYWLSIAWTVAASVTACGKINQPDDRQEDINGLRVLGTSTSPLVATLSLAGATKTVAITIYAAVPLGQTASLEAYDLPASERSVALAASDIAIDASKFTYKDYSAFRLLKAVVTANVPLESKFSTSSLDAPPAGGTIATATSATSSVGGDVNFGIKVKTDTAEVTMTSLFAARATGSSDLSWSGPTITGMTPADNASVSLGDVSIAMTSSQPNDTRVTYGWFVSGGTIANRRVQQSTWSPASAGGYSLVGIVHGRESRGFDIKVYDVTVQ